MASWIWMNVSLMVPAFALTVGIPLWMVLRGRGKSQAPQVAVPAVAAPAGAQDERVDELVAA